ncbi:MAG: hypothetical protein OER97_04895 [Gammaproteobacteria bacterium]|nr:hypothetical protein [Gammaproteobacteria bacterium]
MAKRTLDQGQCPLAPEAVVWIARHGLFLMAANSCRSARRNRFDGTGGSARK